MVSWVNGDVTLEGLLAGPATPGPHPLLVFLHGAVGSLACGEHPDVSAWVSAGYVVFMPDFRPSSIAGRDQMRAAFRRRELPGHDPEAGDVLTGVDLLTAQGVADLSGGRWPAMPAAYASSQLVGVVTGASYLGAAALFVVPGGREGRALALDQELALVLLPPDFGPLFLVLLGVADIGVQRRGVGSRRHVVGVERIEPRLDALVLGIVRERVIIEVLLRQATVHMPVAPVDPVALV